MSDEQLRQVERELATLPADLDLRRQHARQLARLGLEERGLAALDLAWRLGADELFDELRERLDARERVVDDYLTLRYVPAGPFVMGSEELDEDCSPVHLVELSAFYVAQRPLCHGSVLDWDQTPDWTRRYDYLFARALTHYGHEHMTRAMAHLTRARSLGVPGEFRLITEAQWERVFRAGYLRRDGASPYGVERASGPEWTADAYDATYYGASPRLDPPGSPRGEQYVVRGALLPDPEFALYREAATPEGQFRLGAGVLGRHVGHEPGIAGRPAFVPA